MAKGLLDLPIGLIRFESRNDAVAKVALLSLKRFNYSMKIGMPFHPRRDTGTECRH